MPNEGELDDKLPKQETEDEGHEAEADADTEADGEVGDDGEDAAEGDGSETEEGQVALVGDEEKPRSRGETRFQKLSNSAREASERAATAERKAQELERRLAQLERPPQESPEQVAQRLALMTPEERLEYKLDQAERRNQQQISALQFQTQDTNDRSAFSALCASNQTAARYRDRVEQKLAEIRSQGQNVSRESLFKFLVGEDVVAKGGGAKAKQEREGKRRIERQSVQPGNSRGDAQPNKRGEQSAEDRLANVTF